MITNSIRFKTSILYSSILLVILIFFSTYLFQAARHILYQNINEELNIKADQIVGTINAYGEVTNGKLPAMSLVREFLSDDVKVPVAQGVIDKLWEKHRWLLGAHNDFFRIVDVNGEVILQSEDLPAGAGFLLDHLLSIRAGADNYATLNINGIPFRGIRYPFTFNYRKPYVLQLVVPLTSVEHTMAKLLTVMITGIIVTLLLSLFIGSFLTRKILKPVTEVTLTASNISQKNLGIRIKDQALDHEMLLLVDSFNQMIDRLEKSFAHINEFSSHVAHELKTPLSIIKGELELALSADNAREEDRRVMMVTLEEIDRLIKIIKDLLLLAKFDYKLNIFKMERMNLTEFLHDVCRHAGVLAQEKGIRFSPLIPEEELWIQGDPVHLRRLFFNLIHNAVKFTPSCGEISIIVTVLEGKGRVSVKDTGEGIAPADQKKIFEKFYRVRKAGHEEVSGTGLGLCLAQSIARAHGGDIVFESAPQKGSTFTVIFPL
ncbi:MAG: HAMP domain-containing protein [Candidatus Omnitrophica bacterium]|nr:HAMP domain-containing protein [Candidatus Omnitrophota bacterium]